MDEKLKRMTAFVKKANDKMKKIYKEPVLYSGEEAGNFEAFETGFPTFDHINSGIGGFPVGGITLIHGLPSTGKSTFVLEAIEHKMKNDPECLALYCDVENALTKHFLSFKNIFPDRLTISPLNNEDGLTLVKDAIAADVYDIIVIDSLAKLDSKDMMDGDMGDKKQRNQRARIITEFLRFITFTLRKSKTALVLINQEIENQDRKTPYDPKTVLPCGQQQVFSANLRIQLKRSKKIKKGDKEIGYMCSLVSLKNKISSHEKAKTFLSYIRGKGFLREYSVLDYLVICGVLEKGAGYYSFKDKKFYQSKFRASEVSEILQGIYENFGVDFTTWKPEEIDYEKEEIDDESDI